MYGQGRLNHSSSDELQLSLAGVSVTFCFLVKLKPGSQAIPSTTESKIALCLWTIKLLTAIGLSFVKLSIAFALSRIVVSKHLKHAICGIIGKCALPSALLCLLTFPGLLLVISAEWIGSTLLQCIPVSAVWTPSEQLSGRCMSSLTHRSFELANTSLNLATDIFFAILALVAFATAHLGLRTRLSLIAVFGFASVTIVAATIRTYLLYRDVKNEDLSGYNVPAVLWAAVELSTAITSTCLYTLGIWIKPNHHSTGDIPRIQHHISLPQPITQPTYHPNSSSQTVIYRPNTVYTPVTRFHDNVSNLDFDIETPATRTRTHTMRSRTTRNTQSRPGSTWSQFSGFTYYTNPAESTIELGHHTSESATNELGDLIQSLGLGPNIALALRPLDGVASRELDDGGDPVDDKARDK
jgi:hypothetical protein